MSTLAPILVMIRLRFFAVLAFSFSAHLLRSEIPQEIETRKSAHVSASFRPSDWQAVEKPAEFMGFLDEVYDAMAELTNARPPMVLTGYENLGAWGTAGMDGIRIDWTCVEPFMKDFNKGKIEFGFVHEMGHVFDARDFARWYITPSCGGETFANIKLSYALERLLREDTRYRIEFGPGGLQTGYAFNDNFYLNAGAKYLASDTPWTQMSVDDLHSFHMALIRKVGWDVYKKWFRAYYEIEKQKDGRAPDNVNDPARINVVCALLSLFSDENLVPHFQKWRMPVTDKSIMEVAKRYDLKRVRQTVDAQFAKEYVAGAIHLDPLSLRVRMGESQASIFSIFRSTPSAVVRYTLDGTPVTVGSKIDQGEMLVVPAGATVHAALFLPGGETPVLTASGSRDAG